MADKGQNNKVITLNRKAYHDYHVLESLEAGIVLTGSEIKSIREGGINIGEAYAQREGGELWLFNSHIAPYAAASHFTHDPRRRRKLLLHRDQINRLTAQAAERGLTLVPLKVYLKEGRAKVELGLVRGKKLYDKRQALARRDAQREVERAIRFRTSSRAWGRKGSTGDGRLGGASRGAIGLVKLVAKK